MKMHTREVICDSDITADGRLCGSSAKGMQQLFL